MSTHQDITRQTYEDKAVVDAFLAKNGEPSSGVEAIWPKLRDFASIVKRGKVLDIGCGPGIHCRQFARLGFDVTGIDYSQAMIDAAVEFGPHPQIAYRQLDMREIGRAFATGSFDAAWASASLIHVPEVDMPRVLEGIGAVLVDGGRLHVSLKGGRQGAKLVHDTKYGLPMEREFIFWEEIKFAALLRSAGLEIVHVARHDGGVTGEEVTHWLIFTAISRGNGGVRQEY